MSETSSPRGFFDSVDRRWFLQAAGAATAGLWQLETARGYGANDTLNVACIGTGGRCRHLMKSLREIPNVRIAAICDVWDVSLAEAAKLADPQAVQSKNFHEILARRDIDAVLIGSPDHWHVPMTIAACEAGKHVYVEKPLTHDLKEGQAVIEAQNRHRRTVQIGTQQRSMPHFHAAKKLIEEGGIGRVYKVHLTWNRNQARFSRVPLNVDPASVDWKSFLGNAPQQPFDEYRFRQWRWFWDFGGGILTDLMVHFIDVVHWFLDLDHPALATSIGNHFNAAGVWETPDTIQCLLQYPQDLQVYFEGTFVNARNGAMLEFMGSDATVYLDRGRMEVIPERNKKVQPVEMILGTGPRGADFYDQPDGERLHLMNWIESLRAEKKPVCPAEAGVSAAAAAHLGNIAYRSGQVARWDNVTAEQ